MQGEPGNCDLAATFRSFTSAVAAGCSMLTQLKERWMDGSFLVPALALVTMGIVIVLAIISKRKTDARHDDPAAPKSTLAGDTPDRHEASGMSREKPDNTGSDRSGR